MDISIEEQKVVIEAIATLVNIKSTMISKLLQPAGVPSEIYIPLFRMQDPITGNPLSKRKVAPMIIEKLQDNPNGAQIIRNIIRITANWADFTTAHNEFEARATVQKAKEVLKQVEKQEANEQVLEGIRQQEEKKKQDRERLSEFNKEVNLLLMMFDDLSRDKDHIKRGHLLEDLINRLFKLHEFQVYKRFTRNQGGEQIDGAFILDGWYYLVECRWRERIADIRQLDGLLGQIERSGKQTMGLFLCMDGWSENVIPLLKQNPNKSIILMDGYDMRCILARDIDLKKFISAKVAELNLKAEPFLGANEYLKLNL